jgi:hypothetical protein
MKKFALLIATGTSCLSAQVLDHWDGDTRYHEYGFYRNLTSDIPTLHPPKTELEGFEKIENVAQYKMADWKNVVGISRNITLEQACDIANSDPSITFFFYMKGHQMVLEKEDGSYRVFRHHDAVFFTGTPWWGSAPGFSDGYIKKNS